MHSITIIIGTSITSYMYESAHHLRLEIALLPFCGIRRDASSLPPSTVASTYDGIIAGTASTSHERLVDARCGPADAAAAGIIARQRRGAGHARHAGCWTSVVVSS